MLCLLVLALTDFLKCPFVVRFFPIFQFCALGWWSHSLKWPPRTVLKCSWVSQSPRRLMPCGENRCDRWAPLSCDPQHLDHGFNINESPMDANTSSLTKQYYMLVCTWAWSSKNLTPRSNGSLSTNSVFVTIYGECPGRMTRSHNIWISF